MIKTHDLLANKRFRFLITCFLMGCLVLFNIPYIVTRLPIFRLCFGEMIVCVAAVVFVIYMTLKREKRKDGFLIITFVLFGIVVINSLMKNGSEKILILYNYFAYPLASVLLYSLFFDLDHKYTLMIVFVYYGLITVATDIQMILSGMYDLTVPTIAGETAYGLTYIGNINTVFDFAMIALFSGVMLAELYEKRIWFMNAAILILSFWAAKHQDCVTAYIVYILVFLVFAAAFTVKRLQRKKEKTAGILRPFGGCFFLILSVVLCILVLMINHYQISFCGLDPDFHQRGVIWQTVLQNFHENPVLGRGASSVIPLINGGSCVHAHNIYLDFLSYSGLVGAGLLLALLGLIAFRLDRIGKCVTRFLLAGLFGCYLVACQLDVFSPCGFFAYFGLVYYSLKKIPEEFVRLKKQV